MNVFQFEHIGIMGMDTNRTTKDDESALYYVYLNLSKSPSAEWAQDFNDTWQRIIYMKKRRAEVSGAFIIIRCALDELEPDHKPELEKVLKEVNERQHAKAKKAYEDELKAKELERDDRKKVEEAAISFNQKS